MADTNTPKLQQSERRRTTQTAGVEEENKQQAVRLSTQVSLTAFDYVYKRGPWDGAPIVVEKYKLVFFTMANGGCTSWKQLFRRMAGYDNWKSWTYESHNPQQNGLTYLYHYTLRDANRMLTDPEWTRAIFVRDPRERVLSAYLDKGKQKDGAYLGRHCCGFKRDCVERASGSFRGFLETAMTTCPHDPHWISYTERMDRYLSTINFVGHVETADDDAQRLLRRIGAWTDYGAKGWGHDGQDAFFATTKEATNVSIAAQVQHYFDRDGDDNAGGMVLEELVERLYNDDYNTPQFGLVRTTKTASQANGNPETVTARKTIMTSPEDSRVSKNREAKETPKVRDNATHIILINEGREVVVDKIVGSLRKKSQRNLTESELLQRKEAALRLRKRLESQRRQPLQQARRKTTNSLDEARLTRLQFPPVNLHDIPFGQNTTLLINRSDYAMRKGSWDGAPIVLEEYRLIFFSMPKVGCTVFKQLFRRMKGHNDWRIQTTNKVPHNPDFNGLQYLWQYPLGRATEMMTSPNWTRAIFVRDPKERLLSAYLDKALKDKAKYIGLHCCPTWQRCKDFAAASFSDFVHVVTLCYDPHWNPQTWRMEGKYWPHINFVGHLESVRADTKRLLSKVGAWNKYGASGWGPRGTESIFESVRAVQHKTESHNKLKEYYTNATVENMVEKLYEDDYLNPAFNMTRYRLVQE